MNLLFVHIRACHVKCAEKSMKTMTSDQFEILVSTKTIKRNYIRVEGWRSGNDVRFKFWPLFVTQNGIFSIYVFPYKTLKKNMNVLIWKGPNNDLWNSFSSDLSVQMRWYLDWGSFRAWKTISKILVNTVMLTKYWYWGLCR